MKETALPDMLVFRDSTQEFKRSETHSDDQERLEMKMRFKLFFQMLQSDRIGMALTLGFIWSRPPRDLIYCSVFWHGLFTVSKPIRVIT